MTKKSVAIDSVALGEVIDMALSDHVSFTAINDLYGLNENQVKTIMRAHLRPSRYRAWRNRVQTFGDRRAFYKRDPREQERPMTGARKRRNDDDVFETETDGECVQVRKSEPSKRSLANP